MSEVIASIGVGLFFITAWGVLMLLGMTFTLLVAVVLTLTESVEFPLVVRIALRIAWAIVIVWVIGALVRGNL